MAYQQNIEDSLAGLPTLDPTVAAYKKFIEQNKGQASDLYQFLASDQGKALDPKLAGAMIALDRLQKAAANPPAQAPQSTVVDDIQKAGLAAAHQQMQAQRSIPPQQAGIRSVAPQRGPIPQMRGGGVVAFAEGGRPDIEDLIRRQVPGYDTLPPEQKQALINQYSAQAAPQSAMDTMRQGAGRGVSLFDMPQSDTYDDAFAAMATRTPTSPTPPAPSAPRIDQRIPTPLAQRPAAPAPAAKPKGDLFTPFEIAERPDLAKITAAREARQKASQTGAYSKADADLAAYIQSEKDKGRDENDAYKNFWVMTGASLLGNRSPFFLQALGESVKENYGGLIKDLKQIKDDTKQLKLQEIQLQRAKEQAMESGTREDLDRLDKQNDKYESIGLTIAKARQDALDKVLDRQNVIEATKLRSMGRDTVLQHLDQLTRDVEAETDPNKKRELSNKLARYREASATNIRYATAAGATVDARADQAVAKAIENAKAKPTYLSASRQYASAARKNPPDQAAMQAAETVMNREISRAEQDARAAFGRAPMPSASYQRADIANMSDDDIRAALGY